MLTVRRLKLNYWMMMLRVPCESTVTVFGLMDELPTLKCKLEDRLD
jgi:hypothetical protein